MIEVAHLRKIRSLHSTRGNFVQFQIQFQNVHSRLPKKSKLPAFRVSRHKLAQRAFAHFSLSRDSCNLKFRRCRRYMRIETGTGACHEVNRNRSVRVFRVQLLNAGLDAVEQRLVGGSKIRAAAGRGIVSIPRACRGRARMEVARSRERLTDDSRSHELAVLFDQLSVGLARKQQLRNARNTERVDQAENGRGDQSE